MLGLVAVSLQEKKQRATDGSRNRLYFELKNRSGILWILKELSITNQNFNEVVQGLLMGD